MIRSLLLALIFAGSPALSRADETPRGDRDSIIFRNGDNLAGSLDTIDSQQGIRWSRADAAAEFLFSPALVSELALHFSQPVPETVSSNLCLVQLSNGDEFQGILKFYDGEKAQFDTWYGGVVEVPKEALALLVPLGLPQPVLFQGPADIDGWTMGKVNAAILADTGVWHFHNDALYAAKSASIARDIGLPDSSRLEFDLEWRGFFHIAIALYTEYLHPINLPNKESEPHFGGFYSLQLNPFSANLLPVKQTEPLRYLGQAPLQTLSQKNSAHIDIRVSKEKRLIALLVDGVLVKQWVDNEEFAGTGSAIRFVHQGQGAVKLSNLKMTEWDGQFEELISVTPNKSQDLARLKNGDRIIGNVKSVRDGKLSIEAAATVLEVPLVRVKQIELAAAKPAPVQLAPGIVQAYFSSGIGRLTFNLDRWSVDRLTGTNAHLGALTLKPQAFSKLVFDLNNSTAAEK